MTSVMYMRNVSILQKMSVQKLIYFPPPRPWLSVPSSLCENCRLRSL